MQKNKATIHFFLKSWIRFKQKFSKENFHETSMMWPSQNFLLYDINIIKMKVTEWINNFKNMSIPPFQDTYNMYKL